MKKLFFLAATCCMCMTTWAQNNVITYEAPEKLQEVSDNMLGFHRDSFDVAMTSHTFLDGHGTITFAGDVTAIKKRAFPACEDMSSITLPNSVISIGQDAFRYCVGLTTLIIPNTVTSIGEGAFYEVPNVQYTGSATGTPWDARCINGYVEGYLVFQDATKSKLIACSASATGKIMVPYTVDSIGKKAFFNCGKITSVTMSNGVKSLGYQAFFQNYSLTTVTLSNLLTTIPGNAFYHCNSLKYIQIPSKVTEIQGYAFEHCVNLKYIICEATTPPTCGKDVFKDVPTTIPVYVPKSSISAYQAANGWNGFTTFKEYKAYSLYVKGEQITSANDDDILGNGTMSYDDATKTLTLNNANISYANGDAIAAYQDMVIECIGTNTIESTGSGNAINMDENGVTFTGSGSLTVKSNTSAAIYAEGGLTVKEGCTLTAQSANNSAVSVAGESITVDGANLIAKGNGTEATIVSCNSLVLQNGAAIRSNHTYDATNHQFLNASSEEAKDDIIIGIEGGATYYNVWIAGEQLTDQSDFVKNPTMFSIGYYPDQDSLVIRDNSTGYWTIKTTTGTTKLTVIDDFVINNASGYGIEFSGTLTINGTGRLIVNGSAGAFNSNNIVLKDGLKSSTSNYTVKNTDVVIALLCDVWINGVQLDNTSVYVKNPETNSIGYYPAQDSLVLRSDINLKSIKTTTGKTKITLVGKSAIQSTGIGVEFSNQLVIEGKGELLVDADTQCFSSTNVVFKDNLSVISGSLTGESVRIGVTYPVWVNGEQLNASSNFVTNPTDMMVGYYPQGDSLILRNASNLTSLKFSKEGTILVLHGANIVNNATGIAVEMTGNLPIKGVGSLLAQSNTQAFSSANVSLFGNLHLYGEATNAVALIDVVKNKVGVGVGTFSVSAEKKVKFSLGNLLYFEAADVFCLAESQNESQQTIASTQWRSYAKWDADGYKNISIENTDETNLHSLTSDEWKYLMQQRTNGLYLNGFATVIGKAGMVILPDAWVTPTGLTFVAAATLGADSKFTDNVYTAEEWTKMEAAGAIFLPADGFISDGLINFANAGLYYGAADKMSNGIIVFSPTNTITVNAANAEYQYSYRLVVEEEGTAIENIKDNSSFSIQPSKLLRNGQLFILRDGKTYNAQGGRMK